MEYPSEFDVPAFPAGRRIAVSRAMAIATMAVFLLIICACGMLLWVKRSVTIHPFLISVNNITGQWEIVGHNHFRDKQMTADRTLQESVIGKFMRAWYRVGTNAERNAANWQKCDRTTVCDRENKAGRDTNACTLYCLTDNGLYGRFTGTVMPDYMARSAAGETLSLDTSSLQMTPLDAKGGWQVRATIKSNISAPIKILAIVRVGNDKTTYRTTLGYYVADFNAYRID